MQKGKAQLYIIGIPFFFCVWHYVGINVDAIIYTLQVFFRWFPERFADDPAFMYGNQDALSVFSPFYGLFIKFLPIALAAKLVCVLSHVLIAGSVIGLIDRWTSRFHCRLVALPLVILFFVLFAYGESRNEMWISVKFIEAYTVARNFSLGFGILGLAFFFSKRRLIPLFLFILGSFFNPLYAGWGVPLWLFYYVPATAFPISIISLLLPLTVFIGKGSFAPYPDSWFNISAFKGDVLRIVALLLGYVLFFFSLWKKFSCRLEIRRLSFSLGVVVGIACYWFAMTLATHHIFLFQVQTFRIEWMCNVLLPVLLGVVLYERYVIRYRKTKKIELTDVFLLFFLFVFWIDNIFLLTVEAYSIWVWKGEGVSRQKKSLPLILTFVLVGTVYIGYYAADLSHFKYPMLYMGKMILCQNVSVFIAACCLVMGTKPRMQALSIVVLVVCIVSNRYLSHPFTHENLAVAALFAAWVINVLRLLKFKKIAFVLCAVPMVAYGALFYDVRSELLKKSEEALDQFKEIMPFPTVEERGMILYSVEGDFFEIPRLLVLSGAYFDLQQRVGELFIEKQKTTVEHRLQMLAYGNNPPLNQVVSAKKMENLALSILGQKDSLVARARFLCDQGEILYLATTLPGISFSPLDSVSILGGTRYLRLYDCESMEQVDKWN